MNRLHISVASIVMVAFAGSLSGCCLMPGGSDYDGVSDRSDVKLGKLLSSVARKARDKWPDANLVRFRAAQVDREGSADLTQGAGANISVTFGSPSSGEEKSCMRVTVTKRTVQTKQVRCRKTEPTTDHPMLPACDISAIWKRATARGVPKDAERATISYSVSENFTKPNEWYGVGSWSIQSDPKRRLTTTDTCDDSVPNPGDSSPDLSAFQVWDEYPRAVKVVKRSFPGASPKLESLNANGITPQGTIDVTPDTKTTAVYTFVGKDTDGTCREWRVPASRGAIRLQSSTKTGGTCGDDLPGGGPICKFQDIRKKLRSNHDDVELEGANLIYRASNHKWVVSSPNGNSATLDDCGEEGSDDSGGGSGTQRQRNIEVDEGPDIEFDL